MKPCAVFKRNERVREGGRSRTFNLDRNILSIQLHPGSFTFEIPMLDCRSPTSFASDSTNAARPREAMFILR